DRAFADGQTRACLCAFRVMKEYRGQGYGRRLMDAAVRDLKARGFRYATIGVDDVENEKLYRHMGFATKVRDCHDDPCARDANMRPVADEAGYRLLLREL
ncbi:MAG: GNAT family N-acetyltransferase, partial [Solobacterium sp.]|nr:GNAT family N-acetyltransferase [Solobacterium sp.]